MHEVERIPVTKTVCAGTHVYARNYLDAHRFMDYWDGVIKLIPWQYQKTAVLHFRVIDESMLELSVEYQRPETKQETEERISSIDTSILNMFSKEEAEYERLKAKFAK
jgi:hypothetical protein